MLFPYKGLETSFCWGYFWHLYSVPYSGLGLNSRARPMLGLGGVTSVAPGQPQPTTQASFSHIKLATCFSPSISYNRGKICAPCFFFLLIIYRLPNPPLAGIWTVTIGAPDPLLFLDCTTLSAKLSASPSLRLYRLSGRIPTSRTELNHYVASSLRLHRVTVNATNLANNTSLDV